MINKVAEPGENSEEIKIIRLPNGGIRITTRSENEDASEESNQQNNDNN